MPLFFSERNVLSRSAKSMRLLRGLRTATLAATVFAAVPAFAGFTYPGCGEVSANDFVLDTLVRNGTTPSVQEPLKMAFDMDAGKVDVYFTQRYGRVQKYAGATGATVTLTDFAFGADSVASGSFTEGLHGIALDPAFKTNRWIYLFFTVGTNTTAGVQWRVSRYKVNGDVLDRASERTILAFTTPSYAQHMGGTLRFDKQGNLWVSVADNGGTSQPTEFATSMPYQASNTNSLLGKILRIKPRAFADTDPRPTPGVGTTYDIPTGNLYPVGTEKTRPEIYVMGTRNPYTITLDSVRNAVAWGDVGPDNYSGGTDTTRHTEEFNYTKAPGYFGWPYWAGKRGDGTPGTFPTGNSGGDAARPIPAGSTPAAPLNDHASNTGLTTLPPLRNPIVNYPKACAVTGPVYYYDPKLNSPSKFPPHFHGKWFIGDFNNEWIDAVEVNDSLSGVVERKKMFSKSTGGYLKNFPALDSFLEMDMGPDGALYVVNYAGYRTTTPVTGLYRVRYAGTCSPTSIAPALVARYAGPGYRFDGAVLEVTAGGAHAVEVLDLSGRLVWSRAGADKARYDLRAVGAGHGMLVLKVRTANGATARRFVR